MIVDVDTPAAAKLLVDEPASSAVAGWLDDRVAAGDDIVSNLLLETELRSLDALHLATVLRLDAASLLTYDLRLTDAAEAAGVRVVAPGS